MSRIGNRIISVPEKVNISISAAKIKVEGPKGKMEVNLISPITAECQNRVLKIIRTDDSIATKVKHGTVRSLAASAINGVLKGFSKRLLIEGVGFKAAVQGKKLTLNLGFTHPIHLEIPPTLTVAAATPTDIEITGVDRQIVGEFAAKIRAFYEPEPYKGKGVRYSDEVVRRKAGKSVAK